MPGALIEQVTTRAQGNPLYIEELLNYLHDRNLDLCRLQDPAALEWPASLHSLILSRIDRLSARQQLVLKVASIIGRVFLFSHLHGYYPALGEPAQLKADLAALDLTPLETPELAFSFRHIITREVVYEHLAYATRAALHEQYARFLETQAGADTERYLDALAYHYDLSENLPKKREYLRRAGEAAAQRFANLEAARYFSRALELTPEQDEAGRYALLLGREGVYGLMGEREAQAADLAALQTLAERMADNEHRAEVALRYAAYYEAISDFAEALRAAREAVSWTASPRQKVEGLIAWARALASGPV